VKRKHHDLLVWQQAMRLVEDVYQLTASFPQVEQYGLTSQMRRSAVSVPSNIAEGAGRDSSADFNRFLIIARGSLCELETQVLLAQKLGFASDVAEVLNQIDQVFALLGGLINSLKKRNSK
jgi:four helix bundle protein